MSEEPRAINLNMNIPGYVLGAWLLGVTVLVAVVMFRQSSLTPDYKAASVDTARLVQEVRAYVSSEAKYPEFVEVEVMEMLKHVQVEMDALTQTSEVSMVVTSDYILSGDVTDYTDYIFLHAKESYLNTAEDRINLTKGAPSRIEKKAALIR